MKQEGGNVGGAGSGGRGAGAGAAAVPNLSNCSMNVLLLFSAT